MEIKNNNNRRLSFFKINLSFKLTSVILLILSTMSFTTKADNQKEVYTVPSVDLTRYIGKWYEVAAIPQFFEEQCVANTTAEYSLADDNLIKVTNSCDTESGERSISEGRARVTDFKTNAKLEVTFVKLFDWIFTFGGDYWILDLGENYSYSVVGEASRKYAWILGRTGNLPIEQLTKAEKTLANLGYDTCKLLMAVQSGGFTQRKPLCEVVK